VHPNGKAFAHHEVKMPDNPLWPDRPGQDRGQIERNGY